MQRIKKWFAMLILLLIFIISVGFSMWNTVPVPLSFGFYNLEARPLSLWLILAFCFGGLSGLVLGAGLIRDARLRHRIRVLEKELADRPRFKPSEID